MFKSFIPPFSLSSDPLGMPPDDPVNPRTTLDLEESVEDDHILNLDPSKPPVFDPDIDLIVTGLSNLSLNGTGPGSYTFSFTLPFGLLCFYFSSLLLLVSLFLLLKVCHRGLEENDKKYSTVEFMDSFLLSLCKCFFLYLSAIFDVILLIVKFYSMFLATISLCKMLWPYSKSHQIVGLRPLIITI